MLERPYAADLLATAREVVLKELLPALPPEKGFAARMVANAIAIALRESAAAPVPPRDLAALAREIRTGTHDQANPTHDDVARFLRDYARRRAEVSAPRVLSPPQAEGRRVGRATEKPSSTPPNL